MSKLVMVTGTSRGVGAAAVVALLEQGWTVLGVARGAAPLEHERYTHLSLDLAQPIEALPQLEVAWRQQLDTSPTKVALVNNAAALGPVGAQDQLDAAELVSAVTLDLATPLLITGLVLRTSGALPLTIVDVSSGAATAAYPGWSVYCAAKSGLRMAGQALALEAQEYEHLAQREVHVVSYAPGVVATEMQATIRSLDAAAFPRHARFVELHEQGQLVEPEGPAGEIAALLERTDLPGWCELRYGS